MKRLPSKQPKNLFAAESSEVAKEKTPEEQPEQKSSDSDEKKDCDNSVDKDGDGMTAADLGLDITEDDDAFEATPSSEESPGIPNGSDNSKSDVTPKSAERKKKKEKKAKKEKKSKKSKRERRNERDRLKIQRLMESMTPEELKKLQPDLVICHDD